MKLRCNSSNWWSELIWSGIPVIWLWCNIILLNRLNGWDISNHFFHHTHCNFPISGCIDLIELLDISNSWRVKHLYTFGPMSVSLHSDMSKISSLLNIYPSQQRAHKYRLTSIFGGTWVKLFALNNSAVVSRACTGPMDDNSLSCEEDNSTLFECAFGCGSGSGVGGGEAGRLLFTLFVAVCVGRRPAFNICGLYAI